jgi:hypothetical protein
MFGVALVLGLAPVYNVFGDYYEMGSTATTRLITVARGGPLVSDSPAYAAVRSDDLFKLVGQIWAHPQELDPPVAVPTALLLVGVSFLVGLLLALATYAVGAWFAKAVMSARRAPVLRE